MLIVHTTPTVKADPQFGWELVYWLGEAFDFDIPFRAALNEIASTLSAIKPTVINLPPYCKDEDFVEGKISFGVDTIEIYYEYSLGYLALGNTRRQVLDEIASLLRPITIVGNVRYHRSMIPVRLKRLTGKISKLFGRLF